MQSEQKWWPQEVMVRRSHTSRQMGQLPMSSPSASPGPIPPPQTVLTPQLLLLFEKCPS